MKKEEALKALESLKTPEEKIKGSNKTGRGQREKKKVVKMNL